MGEQPGQKRPRPKPSSAPIPAAKRPGNPPSAADPTGKGAGKKWKSESSAADPAGKAAGKIKWGSWKSESTVEDDMKKIDPVELGVLGQQVIDLLTEAHAEGEAYLSGSHLSQVLRSREPIMVDNFVQILKGKGWLRKILSAVPDIEQVQGPAGKDEPCFALKDAADMFPEIEASPPARASIFSSESTATEKTEKRFEKKIEKPDEQPTLEKVRGGDAETLFQEVLNILEKAAEGGALWVEGSILSSVLRDRYPQLVQRVQHALGGKGWMRRLLGAAPGIEQVTVPSKDEPCFALAEHADQVLNDQGERPSIASLKRALPPAPQSSKQPHSGKAATKAFGKNPSNFGKGAFDVLSQLASQVLSEFKASGKGKGCASKGKYAFAMRNGRGGW